ncbi:MAG: response regulator transcription factor [Chitinophagaceae bacterium]|nr:response regulator transcription factor [Chitinophagaceae bacterium]MCW5928127.1 response regulator transcription factor [Chitinophagaceae bacterium]
MPKHIRVALADDHALLRHALKTFINSQPGFKVAAEAGSCQELLNILNTGSIDIDVFLLDFSFPDLNANKSLPDIRTTWPDSGLVIISIHHEDAMIAELFELGIHAFVSKTDAPEEVTKALESATGKNIFENRYYKKAIEYRKNKKRS